MNFDNNELTAAEEASREAERARLDMTAVWPTPKAPAPAAPSKGDEILEAWGFPRTPAPVAVPPLPRNEMSPANAEPVQAENGATPLADAPTGWRTFNELKKFGVHFQDLTSAERLALRNEGLPADEQVSERFETPIHVSRELVADTEQQDALCLSRDLAEQATIEQRLGTTGKFGPALQAPASTTCPAKRQHRRPTVDRLYDEFTRPDRLNAEQWSHLRARCEALDGFRDALFEFVAASVLRTPSQAHNYRYPHRKTLLTMHNDWRQAFAKRSGDALPEDGTVYAALRLVAQGVPL